MQCFVVYGFSASTDGIHRLGEARLSRCLPQLDNCRVRNEGALKSRKLKRRSEDA